MNKRPDSRPDQPPPGQGMGKGMIAIAWLLGIALLTWYFAGVQERWFNPNQEVDSRVGNGLTEITLKRNRAGHYVADGTINGESVTFMLDTGATLVAIPAHMQQELGLERGRSFPIRTANGQSRAWGTRIEQLQLGKIRQQNVRGGLTPGLEGDQILLGMSFLSDLEMLQRGDTLILRQYR